MMITGTVAHAELDKALKCEMMMNYVALQRKHLMLRWQPYKFSASTLL